MLFQSEAEALAFINLYNSQCPTIKLTYSIGNSVNFMDLRIFKGPRCALEKHLDVELYSSPTHKYLYLPPWSFHPASIYSAFILAERQRIRLNCSVEDQYLMHNTVFRERLLARGYTDQFLEPIFNRALDRAALIRKAVASVSKRFAVKEAAAAPLIFKSAYSPLSKFFKIRDILRPTEAALADRDASKIFTARSPVICNTRNQNLGDMLCSSLFR